MKRIVLFVVAMLFCAIASTGYAFELNRGQWVQFGSTGKIELFYNQPGIVVNGNTAKVWLCYHYKSNDSYRLICKEFVRGGTTTTVLKTIDYYSDGTYRRGSSKVTNNVALGPNEDVIMRSIW